MILPGIIKSIGKALLIITALLYLAWYFAPRELIKKQYALELESMPGREIFRILSEIERFPKFTLAVIEPKSVGAGEIQKLTVAVEDPIGLAKVRAVTERDNGIFELPLRLVEGNRSSGYWTSAWVARDTGIKTYRTAFIATNKNGATQRIVLAWSDPCPAPVSDNWAINTNCILADAERPVVENIILSDYSTLVIKANTALKYRQGGEIRLNSGTIAISTAGQIIELPR